MDIIRFSEIVKLMNEYIKLEDKNKEK